MPVTRIRFRISSNDFANANYFQKVCWARARWSGTTTDREILFIEDERERAFGASWYRVSDGGSIHDSKREPVGFIRLGELNVVFVAGISGTLDLQGPRPVVPSMPCGDVAATPSSAPDSQQAGDDAIAVVAELCPFQFISVFVDEVVLPIDSDNFLGRPAVDLGLHDPVIVATGNPVHWY